MMTFQGLLAWKVPHILLHSRVVFWQPQFKHLQSLAANSEIFFCSKDLSHGAGCLPSSGSPWKVTAEVWLGRMQSTLWLYFPSVIAGNSFWYSKMFPELEASQVRLTEQHEQSLESRKQPWSSPHSTQSFPSSNQTLPFVSEPTDHLAGSSASPSENQVVDGFPTIPSTGHPSLFPLLSRLRPTLPFVTTDHGVLLEPTTLFSLWPHRYPTSCDERCEVTEDEKTSLSFTWCQREHDLTAST